MNVLNVIELYGATKAVLSAAAQKPDLRICQKVRKVPDSCVWNNVGMIKCLYGMYRRTEDGSQEFVSYAFSWSKEVKLARHNNK